MEKSHVLEIVDVDCIFDSDHQSLLVDFDTCDLRGETDLTDCSVVVRVPDSQSLSGEGSRVVSNSNDGKEIG